MAPTCVQHMIAVKMPKRSDSKMRRMRKMVVAGGLNDEHDAERFDSNYSRSRTHLTERL